MNYTTLNFKSIKPLDWQLSAFISWREEYAGKATIEGATGIGKTKLAIMAMEIYFDLDIFIVVPTEALQLQWKEEVIKCFNNESEIGLVGGGHKDFGKRITIAIIPSIRDIKINTGLLILDEVHRYFSERNSNFLNNVTFDLIMALTATVKRQDEAEKHFLSKYPIAYSIIQKEAIEQGYLSDYVLINQKSMLTLEELEKYNKVSSMLDILFPIFDKNLGKVFKACKEGNSNAAWCLKLINQRKSILNNAINKITDAVDMCVEELMLDPSSRILLFCESVEAAEKLYSILSKITSVGIYHSKNIKVRNKMLEDFRNGLSKILISAKALDLGLNVPNCNIGIILAGDSTGTQIIQRAGRIIRKVEGKIAKIYQLYIPNTKDEDWLRSRSRELKAKNVIWR